MKRKTITRILLLALVLILAGATAAFGEIDYSQWDSQSAYPQDVVNTKYFTSVKALTDKKVITGDTDGLFHPEKNITRAEFSVMMAKATSNTADLLNLQNQEIFKDMTGYAWAKGYINACYKAGIIKGVGEERFAPGNPVTYVEVIAMIARSRGLAAEIEMYGTWPQNYINHAQLYNMAGTVEIMDWNAPATKGDVAMLMYRNMASLKPATI